MNIVKDMTLRAFLKVGKVSETNGNFLLYGELFEGSSFEVVVPSHTVEPLDGSYVIEVGLVGSQGTGFTEVVLPAPALKYGHHIRVKRQDVISWDLYQMGKLQKENSK